MQQELTSRFALRFVRLDSVGVQRVKQELPVATRNPFTYFKRVIISIDTLSKIVSPAIFAATTGMRW